MTSTGLSSMDQRHWRTYAAFFAVVLGLGVSKLPSQLSSRYKLNSKAHFCEHPK